MGKFVILDTETTGIEEEDRLIQLGMLVIDKETSKIEVFEGFFNPGIEIKIRAMETHNIVPAMIDGKEEFKSSKLFQKLEQLNTVENTMIIHNAPFDLKMLQKEGFELKMGLIDTLRCSKHIYPESEFHRLQYLRYSLGLYKIEKEEAQKLGIELKSHDAIGDCLFLKNLLDKMVKDIELLTINENPFERLKELTKTPVFVETIGFGKHKGKLLVEIVSTDRSWLLWALNNVENID